MLQYENFILPSLNTQPFPKLIQKPNPSKIQNIFLQEEREECSWETNTQLSPKLIRTLVNVLKKQTCNPFPKLTFQELYPEGSLYAAHSYKRKEEGTLVTFLKKKPYSPHHTTLHHTETYLQRPFQGFGKSPFLQKKERTLVTFLKNPTHIPHPKPTFKDHSKVP